MAASTSPEAPAAGSSGRAHRPTAWKLVGLALAMFGFGFALIPLYGLACQLTGANGKNPAMLIPSRVTERPDPSRQVRVSFVTQLGNSDRWRFAAPTASVVVEPGKLYTVSFDAQNLTGAPVVAQAVPNVAPTQAAKHLKKTECFCFRPQPFAAGETRHMPVRFMLDRDLPASVTEVTLAYTLYDVPEADYAQVLALNRAALGAEPAPRAN